jgi:pyrroline-5-carboxylate reductase
MRDWHDTTFGFLGGGSIAEVFARRLLEGGFTRPGQVLVHDIDAAKLRRLADSLRIRPMASNRAVAEGADVVFIAVPPLNAGPVLREVAPALKDAAIVVSLAAAVPLAVLEDAIGRPLAVVRVIPNIPSWIGQGMNPFCWGRHGASEQRRVVGRLLALFGEAIEIGEDQMTIATALTAVGPTYVLPVVDALVEAAVAKGLARDSATAAVCQLLAGTAQLVRETGRAPAELGGYIGIHTLDEAAAGALFRSAVEAAFGKIRTAESKIAAALGVS